MTSHARSFAVSALVAAALSLPTAALAGFACDSGTLATDCEVSTVQTVAGDTVVDGDLTITETGALQYGSATATIEVGGNLQVDGEFSADGDNGNSGGGRPSGDPGNPGEDGGDLTIIVGGSVVISATSSVSANGGNGERGTNGNNGGNNGGPTAGGGGDRRGPHGGGGGWDWKCGV